MALSWRVAAVRQGHQRRVRQPSAREGRAGCPTQEETDAGAEGWSLLGLALDDGEITVLPAAIALFDEALARGAAVDHPCWHYGRGLARGLLADQSDDAGTWGDALEDLWAAWDVPSHPDLSRETLADDLAHALVARAMAEPDDPTTQRPTSSTPASTGSRWRTLRRSRWRSAAGSRGSSATT